MNITDITSQNEVKPLALQCADPHVYFHTDGYYYFTYMRHRELPLAILVHCFTSYACKAVTATVATMSSTLHPRLRSLRGFANPWHTGPIAIHPPMRWQIL